MTSTKAEKYIERARTVKEAVDSELRWLVKKDPAKLSKVDKWLESVANKPDEFWHKLDPLKLRVILDIALGNTSITTLR